MFSANDLEWLLLCVATLVAARWLVRRGIRGRRVGTTPTCARCDFDLTGAPATSDRCPECGADVRARDAVGYGRRLIRLFPFALAAFLVAVVGLFTVGSLDGRDWRVRPPTPYLLLQALGGKVSDRAQAIEQLRLRDASLPLAGPSRVLLVRAMVGLQRNPLGVWRLEWCDWAARRMAEGAALPGDRRAFAENLLADATVSPRLRSGPSLQLPIDIRADLRGRGSMSGAFLVGQPDAARRSLRIDGAPYSPTARPTPFVLGFGSGQVARVTESDPSWPELSLGPHQIEWEMPVSVVARDPRDDGLAPTELARLPVRWSGTIEVVPEGEVVRLRPDPAKAAAIKAALATPRIECQTVGGRVVSVLVVNLGTLPSDVAFEVFAKQGDGPECRIAELARHARDAPGWFIVSDWHDWAPLESGTCTLILRASRAMADRSVDLLDLWDGEIRIDDVPVVAMP